MPHLMFELVSRSFYSRPYAMLNFMMAGYSKYLFEFSRDQIIVHDFVNCAPGLIMVKSFVVFFLNMVEYCLVVVSFVT